jgi:hypothetical protein
MRGLSTLILVALAALASPASAQVFRDEAAFLDALGGGQDCPFFFIESFETLKATNTFDLAVVDAPAARISDPITPSAMNLGVWDQPEAGRQATDGVQYVGTTTCLGGDCVPAIRRIESTGVPIGAIGINIIDWSGFGAFDLLLREELTGDEIIAAFGGQPVGNEQFVGWIIPGLFTGWFDLVDPVGDTYAIDEIFMCGDILPVELQSIDVD